MILLERTQITADYQDFKYKELTDEIILEIKAVKDVAGEHEAQLSNNLKQLIKKLVFYLTMVLYQTLNEKYLDNTGK
jgi:ethanolamine utilization protein EutA (predicted chaperonin)